MTAAATTRQATVLDGRDLVQLWAVGQYVDALVHAALERAGVPAGQLAVIAHIDSVGPLTTTELATAMGSPFMTISDKVDRLIAAGEIRRVPHPTDGRARLLELTPAGRRRVQASWPHIRRIAASIESHLETPPTRVQFAMRDLRRALELALLDVEAAG